MLVEELSVPGRIIYEQLKYSHDANDIGAFKRIIFAIYSNFPEHHKCMQEVIENFFPDYLEIMDKLILLS